MEHKLAVKEKKKMYFPPARREIGDKKLCTRNSTTTQTISTLPI